VGIYGKYHKQEDKRSGEICLKEPPELPLLLF
jgi:hypothetical protein